MNKRKISSSGLGAPFKKPRQRAGAAMYNTFQRGGAFRGLARTGGRLPTSIHELKDITTKSSAVIQLATTGSSTLINAIPQDSTASGRVGRRVVMKSLLLRFAGSMAATSAGASPIRIMVVYDSQTNATAAPLTDVVLTDDITSPMNLSNSRRFKILCDDLIPCLGTGGPQAFAWTKYIKMNHGVEFNAGTTAVIGAIQTGSLAVYVWQNGNIITTVPGHALVARVRYADN